MESTKVKGICLICLKRFDLSSSCAKKVIRYEPQPLTGIEFDSSSEEDDTNSLKRSYDDIYTRFLRLSCRYLKLTSTAEVFLMASTSYKKDTGECLKAFCEDCEFLVSYVCDLYAELQALKLRLVSKLGLIEEVMEDRKKFMPRTLLSKLGMELKEQLRVKSRMRVDSFRMAFHQKCKSKLKKFTPKVLVPRGLLPEEWKFGYPACKLTLMRFIIIFALASSKILPSNDNKIVSTRNDLRPQVARRRKGRPKPKSILKANNSKVPNSCKTKEYRIQSSGKPREIIKAEAEGSNQVLLFESTEAEGDSSYNHHRDLEKDYNSDFSHGAPSPMSMELEASVAGSDDEFKPDSQNEEEETTEASPGKRWNLRKRKRKVIVVTQESGSSDHSDTDYEDPYEKNKITKSRYPNEPLKNRRGWPRIGDSEPSVPCTKCGKMFLDKRSLASHLSYVHNANMNYTCVHCGETFRRWKDRQNHRKKVHPIKRTSYARRVKNSKLKKSERELGRVRKSTGRPLKLDAITRKCHKCDIFFTTALDFQKHKLEIHSKDKYFRKSRETKCVKCPGEVFQSLEELRRHITLVHDGYRRGIPVKCTRCPETFLNSRLMKSHRKKMHPSKRPGRRPICLKKCLHCDKQFPTGKEMMEHRKAEHRTKYTYAKYKYVILPSGEFKCKKCDDIFATKELILEHRKVVHKIEYSLHECPICYRTIIGKERFNGHLKRHELNKPKFNSSKSIWHCEVCAKHFHSTTTLQDHMTKLHQGKFTCNICNVSTETGKLLRDHLVEHEKPEKFFHCMVCFQGFTNLQYYDVHSKVTHSDTRFHCDYNYCNEIVDTVEQLGVHMETHLQDGRTEDTSEEWKDIHKCEKCAKPFIKTYNFTIHLLTHTEHNKDRPGYDCPVCEHTVRCMGSLISHYNREHGLKIMQCKCYICGKEFYNRTSFNAHSRECEYTQTQKEENWVCNFCGVKFDDKESLQKHKKEDHYAVKVTRFHKNLVDELKVCPEEGCGEMRTSLQMNLHLIRAHGKGERYPCEVCGKTFEQVSRLRDHLITHGVGKHNCETCGKAFNKPCKLRDHQLERHSGDQTKRYCCHLCGSSYVTEKGLTYHNWSVHKDVYLKELRHKCPHCDRLYGRKHMLTSHVKNCRAKGKPGVQAPRKNIKHKKSKDEVDEEEEMTDKSTTVDEDEEGKPASRNEVSQVAPILYPHQMPQVPPSLSSSTMSYHQWLSTTAATGQEQHIFANFMERPSNSVQIPEEMQLQSQSNLQTAEESLHQL